ncbi:GNAT family N-acetyltransferase [Paenibacillus prosopidis]|uniref:Acetyltransferase (GNAT) family protein n=1 Tax=Paenibacillus prosopidis TaxID=630520 RepID=A0A368W5E5_9BACL|nr:GNAT family N-acetyltransferase [Paenibacillus prosopidis]RCW50380.1 acetyltransferase (GNAT) family protein [Paenibacillus prosopidis]
MHVNINQYLISDDKSLLDMETIKAFLSRSYWASKRTAERVEKSMQNSLCYGVYDGNKQVGFARVVTDFATMYWLCDVFIDEEHRGQGIGKKLVGSLTTSDELKDLLGILGTKDAHELYEQFGFTSDKERMMRRMPDYIRNLSSH